MGALGAADAVCTPVTPPSITTPQITRASATKVHQALQGRRGRERPRIMTAAFPTTTAPRRAHMADGGGRLGRTGRTWLVDILDRQFAWSAPLDPETTLHLGHLCQRANSEFYI